MSSRDKETLLLLDIDKCPLHILVIEGWHSPRVLKLKEGYKLIVGRRDVEADINEGRYYGMFVDLLPLTILVRGDRIFFDRVQLLALRRMVEEVLKFMVLNYRFMAAHILVHPIYLLYDYYRRKARTLLPFRSLYTYFSHLSLSKKAILEPKILKSIKPLEEEALVEVKNGLLSLTDHGMKKMLSSQPMFTHYMNLVKPLVGIFHIARSDMNLLLALQNLSLKLPLREEEEPRDLTFIETDLGLQPLNEEYEVKVRFLRISEHEDVKVRKLGGILNTTYLVEKMTGERYVVKIFQEWTDVKWLPLMLWAIGSYFFDPLGKNRLINEYSMTRALRSIGVKVPRIYHVSIDQKVIVKEYIEGDLLRDIIVRIARGKSTEEDEEMVYKSMSNIAYIHRKGIVLGDSNPNNVVLKDGEPFFLDLEQARWSDKASWDVAMIIFFIAHHLSVVRFRRDSLEKLLNLIVDGYQEQGDIGVFDKALSLPYLRIYFLFSAPHSLYLTYRSMTKILKRRLASA